MRIMTSIFGKFKWTSLAIDRQFTNFLSVSFVEWKALLI